MFKLNRHFVLATIALNLPLLLGSCQRVSHSVGFTNQQTAVLAIDTTSQTVNQNVEVQTAVEQAVVLQRVKDIFRVVEEDQMSLEGFVESGLCDEVFCSKEWNQLLAAVREKEIQTCTPCFEIDYWRMTHDPELVSYDGFRVLQLGSDNNKKTASVSFMVYDANEEVPARVDMVFENGQWLIDNFHQLKNMLNLRHSMWYYLNKIDVLG